jgi:hypothetical protein
MFFSVLYNVAMLAQSINTGIGPIPTNIADFVSIIGKIGVGLGGVSAIGLMAAGAITILTSAGDPEKLMNGREMITNALMGLALIVLALFVLQLLGWDILGLGRIGGGYDIPFNSWVP